MNRLVNLAKSTCTASITFLFVLVCSFSIVGNVHAAPLNLSDVPMDVQEGVPPNILFTFDTSGSMKWFFIPDGIIVDNGAYARDANSDYNKMYYNPNVIYTPGVDANGKSLGNANFNAAWPDAYDHTVCSGAQFDLSTNYRMAWDPLFDITDGCTDARSVSASYCINCAAFYAVKNNKATCTYPTTNIACYDKVDSSSSSFDKQNFANWYSYYRSRILMAKTTASIAFSSLSNNVRVTQQTLQSAIPAVKVFSGSDRSAFFNWLQTQKANGNTPMRQAFDRAGGFFSQGKPATNTDDPYLTTPGVTQTEPEYSCRQNFNIAITDGQWNSTSTFPNIDPGDDDSSTVKLPETSKGITTLGLNSTYSPAFPYADGYKHKSTYPTTLADVAFYYWAHDLRTDLDNNVPLYIQDSKTDYDGNSVLNNTDLFLNPLNDPANWQHMVNFLIPIGLTGVLNYDPNYYNAPLKDPANSSFTNWPEVTDADASENSKVDDLWHAAINSRGGFYPASDPSSMTTALSNVLNSIASRIGSSSAVATTASSYQAGTSLFQAIYDTSDWHGDLVAYDVTNTTTPLWNAKNQLKTNNVNGTGRNIITYDPATSNGIAFTWAAINASQQALLNNNSDVLDYIRGNQTKEQSNGGSYRNRNYVLGDIVNSSPIYVGPPNRLFPDSLEAAPYSTFVNLHQNREPMVWVGGNDGMLHGFDATTGDEILGYVPSSVYGNLPSLTSPTYTHKFFVDGSPAERDAYFLGNWHTVLVGGLNKGGQGVYALDITDPASFSEGNASNLVLWEFTDANDPELGYTYGTPQVAKMNNGQWMAIFGNGYNNTAADAHVSTTGDAVLYILNMQNGNVVKKLDTDVGTAQDPTGTGRPNGLSQVAVVDIDGNYTVDYIYAGDLFGNLWKFDVTNSNPNFWTVAKYGGTKAPLFIATDGSGNRQPITTAPVVGLHPSQPGVVINFGTGKFLEKADTTDTSVQTFYGVWDRMEPTNSITTIDRASLFAQTVIATNTSQFASNNSRVTSDTPFTWYTGSGLPSSATEYLGWYLNLVDESSTPQGERVIYEPQLIGNRIIFLSTIPTVDPCLGAGVSWIMELNAANGIPSATSVFDYNNDGIINSADLVQFGSNLVVGSGIQIKNGGKLSGLTIIADPTTGNEVKLSSASNATIAKVVEAGDTQFTGRRSWIQLLPN